MCSSISSGDSKKRTQEKGIQKRKKKLAFSFFLLRSPLFSFAYRLHLNPLLFSKQNFVELRAKKVSINYFLFYSLTPTYKYEMMKIIHIFIFLRTITSFVFFLKNITHPFFLLFTFMLPHPLF